ncbi:hypothetical protein Cfor_09103 [Coptotermes formosanus]|uniref:FAM86 N-terminal domain-containing protein n=1 Tax=Coptotermes formosanus TaxID=36987 RepID=A0A6L2PY83_COPFO|nr:hypothetical protein Cfor_09103 [Coptotermes formosanus]
MPTVFIYSLRFVFYSSLGRKLSHLCSLSNCGDLFQLESHGQEILDELYVVYCCLQSGPNTASDTHYRHFVIDHRSTITIKESSSLISQGTTGLCSWQAALALAEWCLCNWKFLHNRHVLELGSGVGLTGLCVSLHCKPSSYWFSDCHPAVLSMLQTNILLNVTGLNDKVPGDTNEQNAVTEHAHNKANITLLPSDDHEQSELSDRCHVLLRTRYNNAEIGVINLPWEAIPLSDVIDRLCPEVILAADVVYDLNLFPVLCQAFSHLLLGRPCVLLLACTVRNQETLDTFMQLLKTMDLEATEEDLPAPTVLSYLTDVPVKIYRISARV